MRNKAHCSISSYLFRIFLFKNRTKATKVFENFIRTLKDRLNMDGLIRLAYFSKSFTVITKKVLNKNETIHTHSKVALFFVQ